MVELFTPTHLLVLVIFPAIFILVPIWQIFKKAGMAAPLAILMVVPLMNLLMLYVLASSKWKAAPSLSSSMPDDGTF